jgi:hypothetical protein
MRRQKSVCAARAQGARATPAKVVFTAQGHAAFPALSLSTQVRFWQSRRQKTKRKRPVGSEF